MFAPNVAYGIIQNRIRAMSDHWDVYVANVNGAPASILVNLGVRDSVPDPSRPCLLWVFVILREPRDDGLSDSKEAPILQEIEDELSKAFKDNLRAEQVGHITTSGRCEFYFYGPRSGQLEQVVTDVLEKFPGYKHQHGAEDDPDWRHYVDVLYPSAEDWQQIQNRSVLQALQDEGDPLTRPRVVSHWSYFKSTADRNRFIAKAVGAGFKVADQSESDDPAAELRCGVMLERVDRVDWNSINKITLELFRLANELGGEYDGWETSIEREAGE